MNLEKTKKEIMDLEGVINLLGDNGIILEGTFSLDDLKILVEKLQQLEAAENEIDGERLFKFGGVFAEELKAQREKYPDQSMPLSVILSLGESLLKAPLTKKEQKIVKKLGHHGKLDKLLDVRMLVDYEPVISDYL
jgi:hypothetical protein